MYYKTVSLLYMYNNDSYFFLLVILRTWSEVSHLFEILHLKNRWFRMTVFTAHLPKSAVLDLLYAYRISLSGFALSVQSVRYPNSLHLYLSQNNSLDCFVRQSANPLPHPGEKFKFLFKKLPTIASFAENIRELIVINFIY